MVGKLEDALIKRLKVEQDTFRKDNPCPEAKHIRNWGADQCRLNDHPCVLDSNYGECDTYEDYIFEAWQDRATP